MTGLAKWIGFLFLTGSSSSCVSANLYDWASEKAPRSEVIGFVDRSGNGDALLVKLEGEEHYPDGTYEYSVWASDDAGHSAQQLAPSLLNAERLLELRETRPAPSKVARLEFTEQSNPRGWWAVDGYELASGALRRVGDPDRRYFVHVDAQVETATDARLFTRLSVQAQSSVEGPGKLRRGFAYLPPSRRRITRVVIAVVAAPFAVAVDVVMFPGQVVATVILAVLWSIDEPDFGLRWSGHAARLGFQDVQWFHAGDPEVPMLGSLCQSALWHPGAFVITAFLPLARNFPLVLPPVR